MCPARRMGLAAHSIRGGRRCHPRILHSRFAVACNYRSRRRTGILPVLYDRCGCFDAIALPCKFWHKQALFCQRMPRIPPKGRIDFCPCAANFLDAHSMVARCKIQVYFSAEHAHIGINSAPTAPGCRRMKHRVLWILREVNSILRPRMTDCILLPIAIGLIEQMNLVIQHNGSWCGNAVRLAQRILLYFAAGCQCSISSDSAMPMPNLPSSCFRE